MPVLVRSVKATNERHCSGTGETMNENPNERHCDFCNANLTEYFIHGKTQYGMFANMCMDCSLEKGTGPAEFYVFKDGEWRKKNTKLER
jgi:hypothetical protein